MNCFICSRGFQNSTALRKHLVNTHPQDGVAYKGVQCTLCDKTILLSSNIRAHLERNHKEFYEENQGKIQRCSIYKDGIPGAKVVWLLKSGKDWITLPKNEEEHYKECTKCNAKVKASAKEEHLQRHKRWSEKVNQEANSSDGEEDTFQIVCNVAECRFQTDTIHGFKKHLELHPNGRNISGSIRFLPKADAIAADVLLSMGSLTDPSGDNDRNVDPEDGEIESQKMDSDANSKKIVNDDVTKRKLDPKNKTAAVKRQRLVKKN